MYRRLISPALRASRSNKHVASRSFHATSAVRNSVPINIDGKDYEVPAGVTILQACASNGIDIPRFCYHERLSIAGNCRMCLVEVEKSPKPVASCAMTVMPNMKVKTDSAVTKKAREGVMELLLVNHPLDCPICDQGGECDLQDQSMVFGSDYSRYTEFKRSVEDKNLGPLVKTIMTRCIHCTRCIRFTSEVAGVDDMGTSGRGRETEVGTYISKLITSELSGNIIDLCPVGALTSKPYAFTARSWELRNTESVDVLDSIGASIRIDSRGAEVMRVLPRVNEDVNEEWLGDKSRFSYDGLKRQRLSVPLVRDGDSFKETSWKEALELVATKLNATDGTAISARVGDLADAESMIALKDLLNRVGSNNIDTGNATGKLSADFREDYLLNSKITGVEEADVLLVVGSNPRTESPLLNARIRKGVINNNLHVATVGAPGDFSYHYDHLGSTTKTLLEIAEGKHRFCKVLAAAERPMILVGMNALRREDGDAILSACKTIGTYASLVKDDWNGFNVLQTEASRAAALDLGILPSKKGNAAASAKFVYLLGADDIKPEEVSQDAFVVYQGHHGDNGANVADVILPGSAYTEKGATYVNAEGRVQRTKVALTAPGQAREDWKIVRALSEVAGQKLPYDTVDQVRERLADVSPTFAAVDTVQSSSFGPVALSNTLKGFVYETPLQPAYDNYYQTNVISRASVTMAKCVNVRESLDSNFVPKRPDETPGK